MKIVYWIFTALLIALMLFSAFSSFFPTPEGETVMKSIGYPYNVLYLLAVFKVLGVVVLLVPGFPHLKEWAYAGFTFDLIGVAYAFGMIGTPIADMAFIFAGLIFVAGSYICYRKLHPQQAL